MKWTADERVVALTMKKNGETIHDIAIELNRPVGHVKNALWRWRQSKTSQTSRSSEAVLTPDQRAQIKALALEGTRPKDIVEIVGVRKNQVIGFMNRANLLGLSMRPESISAKIPPPLLHAIIFPDRGKCLWVDGNLPKNPGTFGFCGEGAVYGPEGRVWCAKHRAIVYTRVPKQVPGSQKASA